MGKHVSKEDQEELSEKIKRLPFNYEGIIRNAKVSTRTFYRFLEGYRIRETTYQRIKSAIE